MNHLVIADDKVTQFPDAEKARAAFKELANKKTNAVLAVAVDSTDRIAARAERREAFIAEQQETRRRAKGNIVQKPPVVDSIANNHAKLSITERLKSAIKGSDDVAPAATPNTTDTTDVVVDASVAANAESTMTDRLRNAIKGEASTAMPVAPPIEAAPKALDAGLVGVAGEAAAPATETPAVSETPMTDRLKKALADKGE